MRMLADHLHLQLFVNPFSAFRRNGQWLKNMFTLAVLRLSAPLFLGVAVVAELCRHAMALWVSSRLARAISVPSSIWARPTPASSARKCFTKTWPSMPML